MFNLKGFNKYNNYKKGFLIVYVMFSIIIALTTLNTSDIRILAIISLLQLIGNVLVIIVSTSKKISVSVIFVILSYITHLGHLLLNGLEIDARIPAVFDTIKIFPMDTYLTANKYTIYSNIFLVLGIMLYNAFYVKNKMNHASLKKYNNCNEKDDLVILKKIGRMFVIIGIVPMIYTNYTRLSLYTSGQHGYRSTFDFNPTGVSNVLSNMFTFGMIAIMISNKYNVRKARNTLFLVILISTITMFSGNRFMAVMLIVTIVIVYVKAVEKPKVKIIWGFGVLSYALLIFINFLSDFRSQRFGSFDYSKILVDYFSVLNSPIFDAIGEFGVTMSTLCYSTIIFPQLRPFGYGITYLVGPLTIFPNIFNVFGHIDKYLLFVKDFPLNYKEGLGGSYLGELYFNFGNYGMFMTIFIGAFFAHFDRKIAINIENRFWIKLFIYISNIPFIFMWTRGYYRELFRTMFWQYLLVMFIYSCAKNKISSKEGALCRKSV